MANEAEKQLYNVNTFKHGADTHSGILGISLSLNLGPIRPFRREGQMIATTVRRVASDSAIPVQFTLRSKSRSTLFVLATKTQADVTVKATDPEDGAEYVITIDDVLYETANGNIEVSSEGGWQLRGVGSAIAIAPAA